MQTILPLFPLELVIFPDSMYPLHIFEERYKKLTAKCIGEKSMFGVVPVVEKEMASIGTACSIIEVINEYPEGKLDILIKGAERFTILDSWTHQDGYLLAKVRFVMDSSTESNFLLVNELETRFRKMLAKINHTMTDNFWRNLERARLKSYKIAEKSALSIAKQVELLKMKDEEIRIDFLIEHIKQFEITLENAAQRLKIIMNDGYVN